MLLSLIQCTYPKISKLVKQFIYAFLVSFNKSVPNSTAISVLISALPPVQIKGKKQKAKRSS